MSRACVALLPFLAAAFLLAAGLDAAGPGAGCACHGAACGNPAGHGASFGSLMDWPMVPAGLLISLAVMVLAALAISLSTRLPPVLSGSVCGVLFLLGLVSDTLLRAAAAHSIPAWIGYRLLPNWQVFWMAEAVSAGGRIPWSYVGTAAGYAGLYAGAVLALGLCSFRQVDLV